MPLVKQPININFSEGLDRKTDPKQVGVGKFLGLSNTIFDKGGLLQKRNGFKELASLPDTSSRFLTTFNGNLTALGASVQAYSVASNTYVNKGSYLPLKISTLPLVHTSSNQTQCDSVVSTNGLVCTVYTDVGSSTTYKYVVADAVTGQNLIAPASLPSASGPGRVFYLGNYFIIVFTMSTTHLQYVAISTTSLSVSSAVDISTVYTPSSTVNFDGAVFDGGASGSTLYLAWNGSDGGGAIRFATISSNLAVSSSVVHTGHVATLMSLCFDTTTINGSSTVTNIYASFYDSASSTGYTMVCDSALALTHTTQIITTGTYVNLTSSAQNGICYIYAEQSINYGYDSSIRTDVIQYFNITSAGTFSNLGNLVRSLGLASKSVIYNNHLYFVGVYISSTQPSYFLFDATSSAVVAKFAYSNGPSSYFAGALPSLILSGGIEFQTSYLIRDLIQSVNKAQGAANAGAGVFTQTGVNLLRANLSTDGIVSSEIGDNLNISGGIVYSYDGYQLSEQGFHLFPDYVEATWSTTGGSIHAQPDGTTNANAYYYQVNYEWTDQQGNLFRSAPSVPVAVTTTGSATTGSITLNVPTLRVTAKNNVTIVIYRWSVANQAYYQVWSGRAPNAVLNSKSSDYVTYIDTAADSSIIGNNLIYTSGGVAEDIGPPPTNIMTLFKSRLVLVDAEDPNLIWYSKQVLENTPVEMSDLFTIYVAPSAGAQGSTGSISALAVMDDKLIIFRKDAGGISYIVGNGPDSTGANNDFSDPIFITSTVGCDLPNSIVMTPQGLMFQSDKGIWLLSRDLSTSFIGAAVEDYTKSNTVLSALNVTGTNQVRFTLSNGITLMYDYYYGQWGTFSGIPAISSILYESLHTYINNNGQVFQENQGSYLDGSNPVLMSFTTSWIKMAGLQGYQRAYYFYLLGTFISPHKLVLQVSYDYQSGVNQQTIVSPFNYSAPWGGDTNWGSASAWGGTTNLEQWQIHLQRQSCQAFQITMQEVFDSTYGTTAGAGLTLSGINCIVGLSKAHRPIGQRSSAG